MGETTYYYRITRDVEKGSKLDPFIAEIRDLSLANDVFERVAMTTFDHLAMRRGDVLIRRWPS